MMHRRDKDTDSVRKLVLDAAKQAKKDTEMSAEPEMTKPIKWPVDCTVGPGLEGAIACETKIGYVNGTKGWLIYRGYDVFDLCANSNFEEVSYLLLHGTMPSQAQFKEYNNRLVNFRSLNNTMRLLMSYPIEQMNAMSALRLGTNLMRHDLTYTDADAYEFDPETIISSDEDSIPMETKPMGEKDAIYKFKKKKKSKKKTAGADTALHSPSGISSCHHLIAGVATIAAAVSRIRNGKLPIEPNPELSHAANFLYMMTGKIPTPLEEKIMDIALILHADHGMNASTFASMVVASTLSDFYFSIGSGVAALNGPLHGGANEQVLYMLNEIGSRNNVSKWVKQQIKNKQKIMGFGHRVYKSYDPRARVFGPLAEYIARKSGDKKSLELFNVATALEKEVNKAIGAKKRIFPNVDFYSGIVYSAMGIPPEMYTPIFAVSRVAGWTARVLEYLENNRIFRPRAMYIGEFGKKCKIKK